MKYYLSSIIPKIKTFSLKLDKISLICERKWTVVGDEGNPTSYIFRENKELLIIKSGIVTKSKWELINKDEIIIEDDSKTLLFKLAFFDENVLVLNLDTTENYLFFVDKEKNSIQTINELENILKKKYLPEASQNNLIDYGRNNSVVVNVEKNNGTVSSMKEESNAGSVIFLIVILVIAVVGTIMLLNSTLKTENSNYPKNEIEKPAGTTFKPPRKEDVIYHVTKSVQAFENENLERETLVGLKRSLTSDSEEFGSQYDFYSTLNKTYPNIFDDKNAVFLADFILGSYIISSSFMKNFYSGTLEKRDEVLSSYKYCYDVGYDKQFCSLMIGKIYRYIIATTDVESHKVAMDWFKKSQSISAYLNIASYYENGITNTMSYSSFRSVIIKQNIREAIKWYKKAAREGSKEAQERVNLLSIKVSE